MNNVEFYMRVYLTVVNNLTQPSQQSGLCPEDICDQASEIAYRALQHIKSDVYDGKARLKPLKPDEED